MAAPPASKRSETHHASRERRRRKSTSRAVVAIAVSADAPPRPYEGSPGRKRGQRHERRLHARIEPQERSRLRRGENARDGADCYERAYSHSIVAGGFDEMSRATRLTPGISLMMRPEMASSTS